MQVILPGTLNKKEWDTFVSQSGGTVFSLSGYLDATADQWIILYNEHKTGGIACPFTIKLGVKTLYAPFFYRYCEWIGEEKPAFEELITALKSYFPVADAQLKWENPDPDVARVHQVISKTDYHPNQQVKRMLKKATGYQVTTHLNIDPLIALLKKELAPRVKSIDDHSLQLLEKLVHSFGPDQLVQLNLEENGNWYGGIWLLTFNKRVLYLKGTVTNEAKQNGGMYKLMEQAIHRAFEQEYVFDFGGSNAEGVRRFNLNWGSTDVSYSHLQWNNAPIWWKTIKLLRKIWIRRSF